MFGVMAMADGDDDDNPNNIAAKLLRRHGKDTNIHIMLIFEE